MQPDQINKTLSSAQVSINDSRLLQLVFSTVANERKNLQSLDGDNIKRVCAEEYDELSQQLDDTQIQESCAVRNVLRTRRLANLLVNDKGELNLSLLPHLIDFLTTHQYSLGAHRQSDGKRQAHIIKVLTLLKDNKEIQRILRQINKPHLHPQADQIIRDTLQLPVNTFITDAHAQRAALSAWMCYLRQNVGSCFATAPAIIVHDEQPDLFLTDLFELLGTGRLKRTFGGIEYTVPLNSSWGAGDLRKPLFLERHPKREETGIWYAPGLLMALEEAAIIKPDLTLPEKTSKIKEKIQQVFPEWSVHHPEIISNAEEIIRRILMHHFEITSQDLQAYDLRPRGMIHANLMMQASSVGTGMGGKGEACSQFYYQHDRAETVFKGLADNALLKAWEFTMASFSETKSEFTRWNLYSSLGLGPDEPGGIGRSLFGIIKQKLDMYNQKSNDLQIEYEAMFMQVKQLESRIRNVSSEKEAQWVRVEYQSKANEFYLLEELRDEAHEKAKVFANLFNVLVDRYDKLFPQYFQEVYDPDLHEVQTGPYDDSPAGFRLLFKHGRANTSQWTKIKTPNEFVDSLTHFFNATEPEITTSDEFKGLESDMSDIVTTVVTHIKTKEFLETAFNRMAIAHKTQPIEDPLDNLEKIQAKPWAYISGGTMTTLVSCYYRREQKPSEISRWVESPMELLVFLIDTLKQVPHKIMESYAKDPDKSILIHSPTHAFTLKPGISPFKEAWQSEEYTYTWARDTLVKPMENFVDNLEFDEEMIEYVVQTLSNQVPVNFQPYFKQSFSRIHGKMTPQDLRDFLLDRMSKERGLQYRGNRVLSSMDIDSKLYSLLPLFPASELNERLHAIIDHLPNIDLSEDLKSQIFEAIGTQTDRLGQARRIISAQRLQEICEAFLCAAYQKTALPFDVSAQILTSARALGYAMPAPIIFADTNWTKDYFAFTVNPGTKRLELWRVEINGTPGSPMSMWREWLDGSRKDRMWGVYSRPQEYTGAVRQPDMRMRLL